MHGGSRNQVIRWIAVETLEAELTGKQSNFSRDLQQIGQTS